MTITLNPDVLRHVVDVHCHPTDAGEVSQLAMDKLEITICAMSSMKSDQQRVAALAQANPDKVIPCFGYHPWFSHLIRLESTTSKEEHYRKLLLHDTAQTKLEEHTQIFNRLLPTLPDPIPLSEVLDELRSNLTMHPGAMVGEVGLDRVFRMPYDYFAEKRQLTPFTISLEHQLAILEAQVDVAVELKRNVSIHSVKSQQATLDLLRKLAQRHGDDWYRISIDMHSCGFSPETWRDTEKAFSNVFVSLSTVINHKHSSLTRLIDMCSPDRILAESDYNNVEMCTPQVLQIIELIAEVKGWRIEEEWVEELEEAKWGAVRRLAENWKRFKKGGHPPPTRTLSKRARKKQLLDSSSEAGSSQGGDGAP
ncbi:TatD DNase family Scn1 [Ephemerocybe angulata]|uniref:TatD DNase family Scn1 n=1 Tax=Ephemerocybe angulata TaxID=980116 RepID=A0A8H6IKF3_9AGAR|nr:TatD DNase family Scn1 [Tulosesus angulatus]